MLAISVLLVDVLHHLELAARGVDLGDGAGLKLVHQLAQDLAVPDGILELASQLAADHGLNPLLGLLLQHRVALGGDLSTHHFVFVFKRVS